jgi:hypothetical protein
MQYLHVRSIYSLCAVHVACTNRRTARHKKTDRQLHSGINWKTIYLYVSTVHLKPLPISNCLSSNVEMLNECELKRIYNDAIVR